MAQPQETQQLSLDVQRQEMIQITAADLSRGFGYCSYFWTTAPRILQPLAMPAEDFVSPKPCEVEGRDPQGFQKQRPTHMWVWVWVL